MKKQIYQIVSFLLLLSLIVLPFSGVVTRTRAATQDGYDNPEFRLTTVDDETIVTTTGTGQGTIIVFGTTKCGITQGVIRDIAASQWVGDADVRVIFAECSMASPDDTKAFANAGKNIICCYDPYNAYNTAWNAYCNIGMKMGVKDGGLPTIVLINESNRVINVLYGRQSADSLISQIRGGSSGGEDDPSASENVNIALEGTESYVFANEVLALINQARAEKGIPKLGLDGSLLEAAMQRAAELSLYYSHTRPDGSKCTTVSSRGTRKAENIAVGYPSPEAAMKAWLGSPGHYANIMDTEMTSVGVGCFQDSEGTWNWVQFFDNAPVSGAAISADRQVTRNVSVQKSFLYLKSDGSKTFTAADVNKEFTMNVYNVNREHTYSTPKLLASNFSYTSSRPSVAEVDSNGTVILKGTGTAVITAVLKSDNSVSVNLTVKVGVNRPNISVVVTPTPDPATPVPTEMPVPTVTPVPTETPESATPSPSASATSTPEPAIPTPEPTMPGPATPPPSVPTEIPATLEPEKPEIVLSDVSGLKAVSKTKQVKLSWNEVTEADGYLLYQYDGKKKAWNEMKAINAGKPSYTIKKLKSGTSYRFAVKAYMDRDEKRITSKSYVSLYIATKPGTVEFRVTAGKAKAVLKWSKVSGATGYTIYYKPKKDTSWKKLKTTKATGYTKTKLKAKKTYYFTVKAYKTYKGKNYTGGGVTKKVKIK